MSNDWHTPVSDQLIFDADRSCNLSHVPRHCDSANLGSLNQILGIAIPGYLSSIRVLGVDHGLIVVIIRLGFRDRWLTIVWVVDTNTTIVD